MLTQNKHTQKNTNMVSVMHAGFSTTLYSRHTYIHANTKQYTQPGVSYTIVSTEQDTFDCSAHC